MSFRCACGPFRTRILSDNQYIIRKVGNFSHFFPQMGVSRLKGPETPIFIGFIQIFHSFFMSALWPNLSK